MTTESKTMNQSSVKDKEPLVFERTYKAPVKKVWKAITDKEEMKKWYFDMPLFKPEPGTEFEFTAGADGKEYRHLCKVLEVIPEKKLSYTWRYDGYEGDSVVTFELTPLGNETKLRLTHAGLETFPASNPDLAKTNFVQGWTDFVNVVLKDYLEK
jgi:uncharacterized protein YndB with AHSA1/START domain